MSLIKTNSEERLAFHNEVSAWSAPQECHNDVDNLFNSIEDESTVDLAIEQHMDEYSDKVQAGVFDKEDGIILFDESAVDCGITANISWLSGLES